jgi:hypothetical protein
VRRSLLLSLAWLVAASCILESTGTPDPPRVTTVPRDIPPPLGQQHLVIAAAGDIACHALPGWNLSVCQYDDTASLVTDPRVAAVLALGDTQYPAGRYQAYLRYYGTPWGAARKKTYPVPGDHEYGNQPGGRPSGYYEYFGPRWTGRQGFGFYSFNLPRGCDPGRGLCWHLIALNSELCFRPDHCEPSTGSEPGPGERQYRWLLRDLYRRPGDEDFPCTIAFFHEPLFTGASVNEVIRPLWNLLYGAGVDVVLNGDKHYYERFRQMDPHGHIDPGRGIRQFIVGTGGASHGVLQARSPAVVTGQDEAFGVLELVLYPRSYVWRWVTAPGQPATFNDTAAHANACI